KWLASYNDSVAGCRLVVIPDNDDAGRNHAADVLRLTSKAASVTILELPGLPPKGDVSDWLDTGGTAETLLVMAMSAEEAEPVEAKDELQPITFGQFAEENPRLDRPIIHGLLRQHETGNIISTSKAGKSWMMYLLSLSVISGRRFLDSFDCV